MSDNGSAPRWTFLTVLVAALILVGVGIGCYFLGRNSAQPKPAPVSVRERLIHDTTHAVLPIIRYVERVTTAHDTLPGAIVHDDAALDSMQLVIDRERRVYYAADTTVEQSVVVLDVTGRHVATTTFDDPLSLICYPNAGYFSVQRGRKPWQITLPVPVEELPDFMEVVWDRFKTGTAYAVIGGTALLILLLAIGVI